MADRYWILGTGNWSDAAHWSLESGGEGGADVPTSSDDVFIDANSGFGEGGTITLGGEEGGFCNDFTSNSGHSYTIDGDYSGICPSGSLTLESGVTIDFTVGIYLEAITTGKTITINGATIGGQMMVVGIGGGWTFQDDLIIAGQFYQENGTFDANDHNVTANNFYFYADTGYTPTVIMGSGIWEGGSWYLEEYSGEVVTIVPESSTIKIVTTGVDNVVNGGKTYNNLWITTPICEIYNSNTFNDLKIEAGATVIFEAESIQIVSTFRAIGTVGNLITLNSSGAEIPTQFTLSKSSGIVSCDYLDISNSKVEGGAVWYAGANSVDSGNNDGWIFTAPPTVYPWKPIAMSRSTISRGTIKGIALISSTKNIKPIIK